MPNDNRKANELAKLIDNTPGFEARERTTNGIRAVNLSTGKPLTLHLTISDRRAYANLLTDLKTWGWTPDMYATAQENNRQERIAAHDAQFPPLIFQEPDFAFTPTTNGNKDREGRDELPSDTSNGPLGMTTAFEAIDRAKATEYFSMRLDSSNESAFGLRNRHYSTTTSSSYARAMLRGEWLPNPDGIKFSLDENGHEWLIDGQQRMAAVIYAADEYEETHGEPMPPITFAVVRNVPHEMFRVLDTGRKRSISQVLQMMGVPNYTVTSSALKYIHLWFTEQDQRKWKRSEPLTGTQVEDLLKKYPDVITDTYKLTSASGACGLSKSALVIAMFLIRYYVPESTYGEGDQISPHDKFIKDFQIGAGLPEKDPVLTLRQYMINRRVTALRRQDATTKMGVTEVMFHLMLIVRAWNNRINGVEISNINWRADSEIPVPQKLRINANPE